MTHPNGLSIAECIDRIDSGFTSTTRNIAAIDFGTGNCSIAYCTAKDEEITLLKLSSQEGQIRVPTILLVNDEGKPIKFGNRALREYGRLDPDEQMKHHLFERIKLALGPKENVCRDTKIPDMNGNMFFIRDVIALFIKYLKDELMKALQLSNVTFADFHWVITVPAIWSASGKQMMREAAYQAGLCGTHIIERIEVASQHSPIKPLEVEYPDRLSLALEPEAASFYCRSMQERDVGKFSIRIPHQTDKYMVVDVGAGTADFSVHGLTMEGNIEVLSSPEGNLSGGFAVNQEFQTFMSKLVGDKGFSRYLSTGNQEDDVENKLDLRSIVYDEFEEEKKEFGQVYISKYVDQKPKPSEIYFNIKLSDTFYDFYEQSLKDGVSRLHDERVKLGRGRKIMIHYSKMEEFFDGPVLEILDILKNRLKQLNNNVHTIYLVGGFGGCQYIHYRVQQALNPHDFPDINIIIPNSPHLAVVQGAFQYRKNPGIINSRVVDATYGTETMVSFNEKIHDHRYLYSTSCGDQCCNNLFDPLVTEGERVDFDKVKRSIFQPLEPSNTSVSFSLLLSKQKDLFYTRTPDGELKDGVEVLGTITVPSPNTERGTNRDIYLTFDFSNTEIQVHAYDVTSNTERRAVIDCLSKRD